jgi:hypothetical protein
VISHSATTFSPTPFFVSALRPNLSSEELAAINGRSKTWGIQASLDPQSVVVLGLPFSWALGFGKPLAISPSSCPYVEGRGDSSHKGWIQRDGRREKNKNP